MSGLFGIGGVVAILLAMGAVVGALDRRRFDLRWLLVAAILVLVNDALLTRFYGLLPNLIPGERNWDGKLLALAGTLAVAALPQLGFRRTGLTLRQKPGSLWTALPVAALYAAVFVGLALVFPNGGPSAENVAFQMTMPGLEEELFYRGVLLFALYSAFAGRWRFLGVEWSWGAVLSCMLFGLAHAFGYSRHGGFSFEPLTFALTAGPSFIAVWVRQRTGSLLLPVLMHNFGNTIIAVL